MTIFLVPGTHSAYQQDDPSEWWYPGSPFRTRVIEPLGLSPVVLKWDTRIEGGPRWPWHWFTERRFTTWEAWGDSFADRMKSVPYDSRIVLGHSHGGNALAWACSQIDVRLLITVSTPVRADLEDWYKGTRMHAERWIHVHSDRDRMFRWGSYFDGKFDLFARDKSQQYADENVYVPKVGHSGLLRNPEHFGLWAGTGVLGHLQDCLTPRRKVYGDA